MDSRELCAMLETPTLWEGRIQVTALIALFRCVDDAFAHPECIENVPTASSPWRMGGIVLTDLMLYIVCLADPEEEAPDHAPGGDLGGNVHIELEDVADSITSLDVYDRSATAGRNSSVPMVVLKVNTFTHELSFVVLSEQVFGNVGVGEIVHHFGILPAVSINHHVYSQLLSGVASPAVKPSIRQSAATPEQRPQFNSSRNLNHPKFDSVSPERTQHGQQQSNPVLLLLLAEAEERLVLEQQEAASCLDMSIARGNALLVAQLAWQQSLLAEAKALNTNIVLGDDLVLDGPLDVENGSPSSGQGKSGTLSERPANDAVRQLLDEHERQVRVKTDKYLRNMRDLRVKQRTCERNADLAHARDTEQRLRSQLAEQDVQLRSLAEALQSLKHEKQLVADELSDYKRREEIVIEKARRREADLHSQLEALKKQLQHGGGPGPTGQSPGSSSDGSPLPPPAPQAPTIAGKFGTSKLQLFGRQQ